MKNKSKEKKDMYLIGGQAVIEGVMMRGKKIYSVAVRKPDKSIEIINEKISKKDKESKIKKLPIIRGVFNFVDTLVSGTKILMRSAEIAGLEDVTAEPESKFEKFLVDKFGEKLMDYMIYFSLLFSLVIVLIFFVFLPVWISSFANALLGDNTWALGIIEGLVRILIFLVYVIAISRMKEIHTVFQYHGAEHKSINCYEDGKELNVQNVKGYSTLNKRCGTSFLIIVMLISMIVFMFVRTDVIWLRFGLRIILIPVIAGISYEVIKWAGRHDSLLVDIVSFPGMCIQRITTAEPDESQIEVAIASLSKVIDYEINGVSWEKLNETGNTVNELLAYGRDILWNVGIESYKLDAVLILMNAASLSKEEVLTYPEKIVDKDAESLYKRFIDMRSKHMPLKYIINECEFMSLNFYVDKNVLIPRPDTEILVEAAIKEINENGLVNVLELCTGSGCIAVSIAKYCENAQVVATDISEDTLNIAKNNALENGIEDKILFLQSDVLNEELRVETKFDIIVCNPPYIKTADIDDLQPDVKNYEPLMALDGGEDGLDFYRVIIPDAANLLNPGGKLMFEIGFDQSAEVSELLRQNGFNNIQTIKDLSGNDRVVIGETQNG